jgi:hypothetical protein
MSRFVKGGTAVLTLTNGDTLIVKQRLNQGEETESFARMRGERPRTRMCTVVAYLLDWQLKEEQTPILGLSADDKEKVLNNLDPDDFDEIQVAIYEHVGKQQKARDDAKKALRGEAASSAPSPSADITAGATTTSNS